MGAPVLAGTVSDLDVAPQQTAVIDLGYDLSALSRSGDEYLNLYYTLKRQDGILDAGTVVSYDQILIRREPQCIAFGDGDIAKTVTDASVMFSGISSASGAGLVSRGVAWEVVFDRLSGALVSYRLGGKSILDTPMMPCFSRAATENDLGCKVHEKSSMWVDPDFRPVSFDTVKDDDCELVSVVYVIDKAATVEMKYKVHGDGSIEVSEHMRDVVAKGTDLMRFGMETALAGEYSVIDFYGNGPFETYADRCSSAFVGHYVQRVEDQYHYGFVRSQESGAHNGLRWFRVLDEDGCGLEFVSETAFSANALPFSRLDLDVSKGSNRHSLTLKALAHDADRSRGKTYVNVDLCQMGLGCVNSWSAPPRSEYMIPAREKLFNFAIRPVID